MLRQFILASLMAVLIAFTIFSSQFQIPPKTINIVPPPPITTQTKQDGRYLFNVVLHTTKEIAGMLAPAVLADKSRVGCIGAAWV